MRKRSSRNSAIACDALKCIDLNYENIIEIVGDQFPGKLWKVHQWSKSWPDLIELSNHVILPLSR